MLSQAPLGRVTIRLSGLMLFLWHSAWLLAQGPAPQVSSFVNAATNHSSSSVPVAARGSIIAIFGANLATAAASSSSFPLPTTLVGTSVLFGGIPAPLLYVSPTKINAQVPFEIPDMTSVSMVIQTESGARPAYGLSCWHKTRRFSPYGSTGRLLVPQTQLWLVTRSRFTQMASVRLYRPLLPGWQDRAVRRR